MKNGTNKTRKLTKSKRDRAFAPYSLGCGSVPRKVPAGKFLWHNHIMHCVGMGHGLNGFRYCAGWLPVDYKQFERCRCGVIPLPHFAIRGMGSGKCVPAGWVLPTVKDGVFIPPSFGEGEGK
jgi:hypothetical protein